MKFKLITILSLYLISLTAFSQEVNSTIIKTDGHVTLYQKKLITHTFMYLNNFWANKGKSLSREMTQRYFTPDTSLIINGKIVYVGYDQFDSHFREVGKKIIGKIRFPLLEVMSVNNKLIVHFNEDIHDSKGGYYPANVIAIFTLKNNKIQRWEEVVNSTYFCQIESLNVVYSK